ncbi:2-phospho-L-lactate guanylyltransferase [Caulobacter sp. LARHSG274]
MNWRAVVPLKARGQRKTRLAAALSAEARDLYSERMFDHVASQLADCPGIDEVTVLAPARPQGWSGAWAPDGGLGLNAELMRLRATLGGARVLVVHADLPWLCAADVAALLQATHTADLALAPDRHGSGTNAVALAGDLPFGFCFGPQSLALHRVQRPGCAIVVRPGLSFDVDTPEDLAIMRRTPARDAVERSRLAPA